MNKKILLSLLFIFVSQLNAADMIYTWGYGDLMNSVLTAVSFTFASGDFMGIFKFALLIAVIMALISSAKLGLKGDMLSLPKLFLMSIGVSTLFISWKIDVVVQDATTNQTYLVSQVPWGVAKPLVWFTGMEEAVGNIMETTFAVPGSLTYNAGGFLAPFGIMDAAGTARITDPDLLKSIDGFFQNCVAPDVANGYYDVATLASSTDLWSEFSSVNPSLVSFDYKNGSQTLMDCATLYSTLTGDMQMWVSGNGMAGLGQVLGGMAAAQVSSILGTASQFFLGYQQNGESYLMQSVVSNQFNDSYSSWATANGTSNQAMAYGIGKGEQTAQANMIISGTLGGKYLPVIKGILTIIIVGLTPIVALLLITPMFWKILTSYLVTLIWLSLWHIGELILNFIILVKASSNMAYIANGTGDYTLMTKPVIDSSFMDYVNMAGSMYWMIPSIAGLIVGGFSYMAMSGLAGAVGGSVQSGPRGVASEVAGGSASFGNVGMNSFSANGSSTASAMSVGTNANVSNSFTSNSGSNITSANAAAAGGKYRFNGKEYDNAPAYTSSGNSDKMTMGGTMKSNDGKETMSFDRGAILVDHKPFSGEFTTENLETGTKTTKKFANGKMTSSESTLSSGYTLSTVDRGGVKQSTLSNKDASASITYETDTGKVIGTQGLPVDIQQLQQKSQEHSNTQGKKAQIGKTIEAVKNENTSDVASLNFLRSSTFGATKEDAHVSQDSQERAKQELLTSLNSVADAYSKGGGQIFTQNGTRSRQNSTTDSADLKVTGSVSSDKAILGKITELAFGAKVGASATAGITNAHVTADGVSYTNSKGVHETYDFSEQFKKDHAIALAKIEKHSETSSHKDATSNSDSSSVNATTGHSSSVTSGKGYKNSESYLTEIGENYIEKTSSSASVGDSRAITNEVTTEFLKHQIDEHHKGGINGAIIDLLNNNKDAVDTYKNIAQEKLNIKSNDNKPLTKNEETKLNDIQTNTPTVVDAKTAGSDLSATQAVNATRNPSLNSAKTLYGNHGSELPQSQNQMDTRFKEGLVADFGAGQKSFEGKHQDYQKYNITPEGKALGGDLHFSNSSDLALSPIARVENAYDDLTKSYKGNAEQQNAVVPFDTTYGNESLNKNIGKNDAKESTKPQQEIAPRK